MAQILPYIQILLSVILVVLILMQQSESGLGSAFGGADFGAKHTRRGFEKLLFNGTIAVSVLFVLSTILALLI